ncbi:unnamed protein product [Symbiodinium necroappetens]|uniref:DUF7796 domain-containing protein n=1 Tax=Symbiodinium necroappetens TaxID=1628268 RepID=A0A812YC93_9DINO|nr:unnamed protein product [Symbiodinium necroappetens]
MWRGALVAGVGLAELSCPAGPGGEACRLSAAPSWRSFGRCAIPAGNDLGEALFLTAAEAKDHCEAQEACAAFTFEGEDLDGLSESPVWVHFKTHFDCVDAAWVAWRKVDSSLEDSTAVSFTAHDLTGLGVALCLMGQVRMLSHTHVALEQHVLQVLKPDVFLYGPRGSDAEPAPKLHSLEDYVVEEKWEVESIRDRLYAETRNPSRTIDVEYVQVQGNWFGSECLDPPLHDKRPGSAICWYYSQQKCLEMIQKQEHQRGQPYQWVVVSRFDFRWLAPHPPLELLKADVVWIPSGSDWEGGINDRHAVIPRRHAEGYLSSWKILTSGRARDVMLDTLGAMKVNGFPGPNTENFLKARLQFLEVEYERFPNVAYLTCTLREKSRWTQCFGTASSNAPGWLYKEEMEHATRVANCVRSSWNRRKMEDCAEDISHLYRGLR